MAAALALAEITTTTAVAVVVLVQSEVMRAQVLPVMAEQELLTPFQEAQ